MALSKIKLQELYEEVKEYLDKGNAQDAKSLLDNIPIDSADNLIVEYLHGVCDQELGNYKKAAKRFKYVISMNPEFIGAAEALIHIEEEELTNGQMKYLYELIIAEKPRVSNQILQFMQSNEIELPETLMDYSTIHIDDDFQGKTEEEEHFDDNSMATHSSESEMKTEDNDEDRGLLENRTQEAMEDPDSLLDNVFNEPNSEETITKTTTEETEEIEENPNNLSEIQLANLLSNAEDEAKISSADSIIEEETIDKSLTEDSTIDETLISDDVSDDVSLETETPIDVPKTEDQAVADEPEIINNTELNTIDTSDSDTETETPVEPVVEKVPEKVPETKESPEKIKEQKAVHVEKLAPIRAYAAKKKNSRVSVEENKLTGEKIVRVETMTMAEIYIKQGLYREALQILEKLKEKATNVSRIEEKIKKVTLLLAQEKK